MDAIIGNIFTYRTAILGFLTWFTRSPNRWTRPMFIRVYTDYFRGDFERHGKEVYHEHYLKVHKLVSAQNLLEYRVEDGWEPICDFLDLAVPHIPFPNGNTRQDLDRRVGGLIREEACRLTRLVCLLSVGIAVLVPCLFCGLSAMSYI